MEIERSSITIGDKQVFTDEMDLNLDGCLAKLDRAYEHLRAIHDELVVFYKTNPYVVIGEFDSNSGWYVMRLVEVPQPSPRVGVILGEYVHQVRSIMDHLIAEIDRWYFAQKRKGCPKSGTRFIVERSAKNFRDKSGRISALPQDWQDLVERMQPYHSRDKRDALGQLDWLEDVWNADKHSNVYRIPIPGHLWAIHDPIWTAQNDVASLGDWRFKRETSLVLNAEIARIRVIPTGPSPHVDMQGGELELLIGVDETRQMTLWSVLTAAAFSVTNKLSVFPTGSRARNHPMLMAGWEFGGAHYRAPIVTA
jgi:hypothetical protein